jgi:hypothetical protein
MNSFRRVADVHYINLETNSAIVSSFPQLEAKPVIDSSAASVPTVATEGL